MICICLFGDSRATSGIDATITRPVGERRVAHHNHVEVND